MFFVFDNYMFFFTMKKLCCIIIMYLLFKVLYKSVIRCQIRKMKQLYKNGGIKNVKKL